MSERRFNAPLALGFSICLALAALAMALVLVSSTGCATPERLRKTFNGM